MCYLDLIKYCKISAMLYLLNHVTDTTINVFCFIEFKHSALNAMCYLNQVKHCRTSAMLFLNYVKHNRLIALCVLQHMLIKTQITRSVF